MRRLCSFFVLVLASPLVASGMAGAQADSVAGGPVAIGRARADSAPPPAFSRVEVVRFGAVIALGGLAYLADDAGRNTVRSAAAQESEVLRGLTKVGNRFGQPGVMGLGLLMWGGGLIADRPTVAASGLRALEAIAVSGFVTQAIKEVAGRARPAVGEHERNDWQLLRGARTEGGDYEAMASGHTTAAFAFAAAVTSEVARRAPEQARLVGITTYGLATVTAFARMHDDRHWLSDVTVGAGIGTVTAWAITRWHATRPDNAIDRILLRPNVSTSPSGELRIGLTVLTR